MISSAAASVARQSIAFFTSPRNDAIIHSIVGKGSDAGPVRYDPITAGEHVRMKIERTTL